MTIVRTIEIAGVSGAAVLFAPEMQEMMRLMGDSEIHGVVTREFSRLMRPENFSDYALLQAFADSKTILYLPDGPIDFSSKTGRLLGGLQALIGGMERTEILERIWNAKEIKRRKGQFGQGWKCLPLGVAYDSSGWHYTPDSERIKEAFRLFLSGNTSYAEIGETVNIRPLTLRILLRNPIYNGWRVIDKKRDLTPAGRYSRKDGRQADRRKVKRDPDDVIRIQVISEPLVSDTEFNRVQQMMDLKRLKHSRINSKASGRFTYNSFLNCFCGATLYAKAFGADYYACKNKCGMPFQRRDRLEAHLHKIFASRLTSPSFLKRHVMPAVKAQDDSGADSGRVQAQLKTLSTKRQRILDAYFEGVISASDRDVRTKAVDQERCVMEGILGRARPKLNLTIDTLVNAFAPFVEFDLLSRDDKRKLLNVLMPEITVSRYEVKGMSLCLETTRMDADDQQADRIYIKLGLKAA